MRFDAVHHACEQGYDWRYSVGFDVTEPVRSAIVMVPARAWSPAVTPEGKIRTGAYVADLTGLLTLADGWPEQMRVAARVEPLHPRHRKQASDIEKKRSQRFQATAHDLPGHHHQRHDVFHRNHAGVETVIKHEKGLGLGRFPFYAFAANQAWCLAAMLAADLLAHLRLLILDHHPELRKATPARLRERLLKAPAWLVRRARNRIIRLADDHPHATDLILAWAKIRALATPPP
ncbi:transposase [Microtetraspora sp. AC03309]|uniref:transposase n=1 Tax=Microtetraspora sp. AC03309 TaxID=2779376 RepID=UPI001E580AC5|nr:transposase [Microtetraspora sp. AC03309]MCC5578980.1 transposase [Microtetraspora sp. AC03309]